MAARQHIAMTTASGSIASDPKELPKPLSPYALFFRDTVNVIKPQNPNCTFRELTRIVATMWEVLDPAHKDAYNQQNEVACNDYLNKLRDQQLIGETDVAAVQPTVSKVAPVKRQKQQAPVDIATSAVAKPQQKGEGHNSSNPNVEKTLRTKSSIMPLQAQVTTKVKAVQKCSRENCNKPAIVHPDWDDEYCSHECVVLHCRNVFASFTKSLGAERK